MDSAQFSRAALLFSQSVAALARIEGMKAFNLERQRNDYALGYSEEAFEKVILEFGIGYNDARKTLEGL